MKKIFFTFITILTFSAICFAQQSSDQAEVLITCRGKITSITVANSKSGTPAEITVIDEKGQIVKFVVKPSTVIYDEDDNVPSLGKIGKEDNVVIEYSTTEDGSNVAQSVKSVE